MKTKPGISHHYKNYHHGKHPHRRRNRSKFGEIVHRLTKSAPAMAALSFLFLLVLCAVFAEYIAPYDYAKQDLTSRLLIPNKNHLMGTDDFGRDILSRLIFGGRMSLLVSAMAVGISIVFSLVLGALAGYFGGLCNEIIMRILDVFLAIPGILMTIVVSVALGSGIVNTAIAMAVGSIPGLARQLQSSILLIRDQEYIEAARSFGSGNARIIWKHVLPNSLAPVIVQVTLRLGESITTIASLSFVGLGVQPPTPEWGNMLASGQEYIRSFWPLITFPGIFIGLSMLAFNFFGDALRDAMDPRLKR